MTGCFDIGDCFGINTKNSKKANSDNTNTPNSNAPGSNDASNDTASGDANEKPGEPQVGGDNKPGNRQLAYMDTNKGRKGGSARQACYLGHEGCMSTLPQLTGRHELSPLDTVMLPVQCGQSLSACLEFNRALQSGELPKVKNVTVKFPPQPPFSVQGGTVILIPGDPEGIYIPPPPPGPPRPNVSLPPKH